MWTALVVIAVGLTLVLWLRRGRRAFVVRVQSGELRLLSGWLPGPMLADYRSALRGLSGEVEGHFEEGGLRVTVSGGIDELVEQRLRNIARLYPLASFRASRKAEHQVLRGTAAVALMSAVARRDE